MIVCVHEDQSEDQKTNCSLGRTTSFFELGNSAYFPWLVFDVNVSSSLLSSVLWARHETCSSSGMTLASHNVPLPL
jgi:hypothetical protein